MKKILIIGISIFLLILEASAIAKPLQIVAAENFYGDIAKQIGGPYVQVMSIMSNPNQDPHLFSTNPATAKAITAADIVIYNGIGYDAWMPNLLTVNQKQDHVIVVADLIHKKMGDNPHIWYAPVTMPAYTDALTKQLIQLDPKHRDYFNQQHHKFLQSLEPIQQLIKQIHTTYSTTPVIATEPVFGYMSDALGLTMYGQGFQLSVMNDTEPSAADIGNFEEKLKNHKVKVLIFNDQVVDPLTERMKNLAKQEHIPIVGISETQALKLTYQTWMTQELVNLKAALNDNRL